MRHVLYNAWLVQVGRAIGVELVELCVHEVERMLPCAGSEPERLPSDVYVLAKKHNIDHAIGHLVARMFFIQLPLVELRTEMRLVRARGVGDISLSSPRLLDLVQ